MKINLLLLASGLFLATAFISCDNDDDDNNQPVYKEVVPSKITYNYGTSTSTPNDTKSIEYTFEYDDQGRISKYSYEYFDNGVSRNFVTTTALEYNGHNIKSVTTRSDTEQNWTTSFSLTGSEIKTNQTDRNPIKLDLKHRPLSYGTHASGEEKYRRYFVYDSYEAYNSYGNTILYTWHPNQDDTTQQFLFIYDNKNGIFKNVTTPTWYIATQIGNQLYTENLGGLEYRNLVNNCTEAREIGGETIYTYINTYNSDNYPSKITRDPNYDGGEIISYEIEYFNLQ